MEGLLKLAISMNVQRGQSQRGQVGHPEMPLLRLYLPPLGHTLKDESRAELTRP